MRVRSVVLPVVVVAAGAVVLPAPAQAASQCSLVMPTKVVVNQATERMDFNLASNCETNGADHAYWDLDHSSGFGGDLDFESADIEQRYFYIDWYDTDPMGNWHLQPQGAAQTDGDPLTQNSAVVQVKYASKLITSVTRTSTGFSWAATAKQWSGRAHTYVVRPNVTLALFHQTSSSAAWTYVKSAKTSSTGKATVSLGTAKTGNYRLMVAETPTVWASYSSAIKGRI